MRCHTLHYLSVYLRHRQDPNQNLCEWQSVHVTVCACVRALSSFLFSPLLKQGLEAHQGHWIKLLPHHSGWGGAMRASFYKGQWGEGKRDSNIFQYPSPPARPKKENHTNKITWEAWKKHTLHHAIRHCQATEEVLHLHRTDAPLSPSTPVTLPAECESARAAEGGGGRTGVNKGGGWGGGVERGRRGVCLERSRSPGEQLNTGESDSVTNVTHRELLVRLLTVFNGSHVCNAHIHIWAVADTTQATCTLKSLPSFPLQINIWTLIFH